MVALRPLPAGVGFEIDTDTTTCRADQVVVTTGPFQRPSIPEAARGLAPHLVQLHSSEYRNPDQLPPGDVLVVGGGNSGARIAADVAATRPTSLSVGQKASRREMLVGSSPGTLARDLGVQTVGRAERADGTHVHTRGGEVVRVAAVVWATGFRSDYHWIQEAVLDRSGLPVHTRGITACPGLYFLGLP